MTLEERTGGLKRYSVSTGRHERNTEPVTLSARCETGAHSLCRGRVFSMTGNRPCECPVCNHPKEASGG
jgi:hypothetical protein